MLRKRLLTSPSAVEFKKFNCDFVTFNAFGVQIVLPCIFHYSLFTSRLRGSVSPVLRVQLFWVTQCPNIMAFGQTCAKTGVSAMLMLVKVIERPPPHFSILQALQGHLLFGFLEVEVFVHQTFVAQAFEVGVIGSEVGLVVFSRAEEADVLLEVVVDVPEAVGTGNDGEEPS